MRKNTTSKRRRKKKKQYKVNRKRYAETHQEIKLKEKLPHSLESESSNQHQRPILRFLTISIAILSVIMLIAFLLIPSLSNL